MMLVREPRKNIECDQHKAEKTQMIVHGNQVKVSISCRI